MPGNFDYLKDVPGFGYSPPPLQGEEERERLSRRSFWQTLLTDPVRAAASSALRTPEKAVDFIEFLQKTGLGALLPVTYAVDVEEARRENPFAGMAEEVAPPPATNFPGKVLQAVGSSAPDVAAMIAAGPVGGTAYMGGLISGQSFKEAKERGVSTPVAATKAIAEGAIGAVLERVGAKRLAGLLKPLGKGARTRLASEILNASGVEAGTEGAQELVSLALEKATGKEFAEGEVSERLTVAPLAGAAMGGGIGAVSVALPSKRGTIGAEAHDKIARYTTTQKRLDQAEQKVVEQTKQESGSEIMKAQQIAGGITQQVDQALGWSWTHNFRPEKRKARLDFNEQVQGYITAKPEDKAAIAAQLPEPVVQAAEKARQYLDFHTRRFLDSPWLKEEQRKVLEANLYSYMRRSFRVHDDPAGRLAEVAPHRIVSPRERSTEGLVEMSMGDETVMTTPEWKKARDWLGSQEQNLDDAELDEKLASLFQIPQPADPTRGAYVSPDVQMIDRSPFMRRKGTDVLPQELLDLFGEHKTPEVSFVKSIERTANAYHRAKMYETLVQNGMMKGLLSNDLPREPGWVNLKEAGVIGEELVRMQPMKGDPDAGMPDPADPEVATALGEAAVEEGAKGPFVFTSRKGYYEVEATDGRIIKVPVDRVRQRADLYGKQTFLDSLDMVMNTNPWFGVKESTAWPIRFMVGLSKGAGAVKAGLTVYQMQAQARNLQSNVLAIAAGGNLLPGPWDMPWFKPKDSDGKAVEQFGFFKAAKTAAGAALQANDLLPRFLKSEKFKPIAVHLAKIGAKGGSVEAAELETFGGTMLAQLEGSGSVLKQIAAKPFRLGQKLYYAGDDVAKAMMYFRERQKLLYLYEKPLREGLVTLDQLEAEAAEVTQQTAQNYDRLPQLARDVRALPFTGPFVSFPLASMINLKNQVKRGFQETGLHAPDEVSVLGSVKPDSKRAIAAGANRLVSTAVAATGAASVIQGLVLAARSALGEALDKDWEPIADVDLLPFNDGQTVEDMLQAEPWWGQASNHVILHKENGKIWSLDFSYMNYFNYMERPIMAALRGGTFDEPAFDAAINEVLQPFVSQDILIGAAMRVYNNEDQYGNPIYEIVKDKQGRVIKGDPWEQLKAGLDHMALSFVGPYKSAGRLWKTWNDEGDTLSGASYNKATESLALLGPRIKVTDFERTLSHRARDQKDALNQMRRATNKILREPGEVNPQAAQLAVEADIEAATTIFRRLQALYQAGIRQGASREALDMVLLVGKTGVSKAEAAGIIQGQDPAEMARAWVQKAVPNASKYRNHRLAMAIRRDEANHPDWTPEDKRKNRERLSRLHPPVVLP